MLEGQLQAAKTFSERSTKDLHDAQGRFTEASMRLASLESECAVLRLRVEEAETEARELKERNRKATDGMQSARGADRRVIGQFHRSGATASGLDQTLDGVRRQVRIRCCTTSHSYKRGPARH
jgi:predicted  nucleic acid-binding Zn-ribbon protein